MSWSRAQDGAHRRARAARRRRPVTIVALGLAALASAGCGFEPLYDEASPASRMAGSVAVDVIDGEPGYVLRERLTQRLGSSDAPSHVLSVDLDFDTAGVALTSENVTTRLNVIGTATFVLRPTDPSGAQLADEVAAITGFSAPDSEATSAFATSAAERDAELRLARTLADRIVARLALTAPEWAPPQPADGGV